MKIELSESEYIQLKNILINSIELNESTSRFDEEEEEMFDNELKEMRQLFQTITNQE